MKKPKKVASSILIVIMLFCLCPMKVFAIESVPQEAALHNETFTVKTVKTFKNTLYFSAVKAGSVSGTLNVEYKETWVVDSYGNKREFVSQTPMVITSGKITSSTVSPPRVLDDIYGTVSKGGLSYVIHYQISNALGFGGSYVGETSAYAYPSN